MRRLTVFLALSCCCDFICFRAVAAKSAIEPAGDYIGIVPAPLETKRLQGKPIELGFTAVLIKKGSPVQHQYMGSRPIGAKVVSHARYVTFQMAEVLVSQSLFYEILERIKRLKPVLTG